MRKQFHIDMVWLFPVLLFSFSSPTLATSITPHNVTDTLKPQHEKYSQVLKVAEEAFLDAEKLFTDPSFESKEGWKKEGKHAAYSSYSKPGSDGKIVLVSTVLDGRADDVMHETWGGIEALSSWNPTIAFANFFAVLSDNVDIVYYANNDVLVVTGREFLTVRIYRQTSQGYIMAARSVDLPDKPERKERVRARMFLAATQFRPDPTNPRKSLCDTEPAILAMVTEQNIKYYHELSRYS